MGRIGPFGPEAFDLIVLEIGRHGLINHRRTKGPSSRRIGLHG